MPASSQSGQQPTIELPGPTPGRVRLRRRYHFGSPGFVYVFITLLIALGAFNSQNNLLFWAFGFSLATLIVSGFLSGAMLMGVSVTRDHIADAHAGGRLTIRYRVRNSNRFIPLFAITIEEQFADSTNGTKPRKHRRKAAAPAVPSTPPLIGMPRAFVTHVGPRQTAIVEAIAPAHGRGLVQFRSFTVHTSFPFGIMRKSVEVFAPATTVILPTLAPVDATVLDSATSRGESSRASRYRGAGDEFHSLREYTAGDSPKSIAWKPSARRGHLLVKQSLAPSPRRAWLVLRMRISSSQTDARDELVISTVASMLRQARERGVAVGVAVPLTGLSIPPRSDPAHFDRLMRELGQINLGLPSVRGRQAPFPLAAANFHDACICIHAGEADVTYGPADRVTHMWVTPDAGVAATAPSRSGRPPAAASAHFSAPSGVAP